MVAYMIAESMVNDPTLMQDYAKKAGPTVAAHGGKVLVAAGTIAHMDGAWNPKRLFVIEFPSMAAAKGWYNSPEYQAILPMRRAASTGSLVFVEGTG